MTETPEQKEKELLDGQWDFDTKFAERMTRFDEALMGKSPDTYRQVPGGTPQANFLKTMDDKLAYFGQHGITSSQFQSAVDEKQREQGETNIDFDIVQFYREAEEELKVTPVEISGIYAKFWRLLYGKTNETDRDFDKKVQEYHGIQLKIDDINKQILELKEVLARLHDVDLVKAVNSKNKTEERETRQKISEQQGKIRNAVAERTGILEKMQDVQEYKTKVWEAVQKELKAESEEIKMKFGGRVYKLFTDKQSLIEQLNTLNNDQPEQLKTKYEIHKRINEIDLELENLKKELVAYKAKNPVFLFERLFGVISVPELYRYGQESSEIMKKLWDKEEEKK